MAYKALYRSYRPTSFEEVVGQKPIIRTLQNALKENKISHAYVFSGSRGIGKTTIARILAKAVNCESLIDGEPCNHCKNCLSVMNDSTTDIIELDAASNNGVDEMRDLLEKVNFLPSSLTKKVYIIDEVHMLTTSSFNALLKTLEEPPAYAIFILATTEPQKLPLTILSRCQRFNFKPLSLNEIKQHLAKVSQAENITITDEALTAIAEAAEGGMRDALSILDQVSVYSNNQIELKDVESVTGRVSFYKALEIITALRNKNATNALLVLNELIDLGKDANSVVVSLIKLCRDLLLYKTTDDVEFYKYLFDIEEFQAFANEISTNELFYYIDVLTSIQNKIKYSNTPKIFVEIALMKIVNRASEDIDIINRINKIENQIASSSLGEISNVNYDNNNPQIENRLNLLEGKIKRIITDLDKMDIKGFKETTLSKFNVLEDAAAFVSSLPRDITQQLETMEETLKELIDEVNLFKGIVITNQSHETKEKEETDININNNIINETNNESIKQDNLEIDIYINEKIKEINDKIVSFEDLLTKVNQDNNTINENCQNIDNRVVQLENSYTQLQTCLSFETRIENLEQKNNNNLINNNLNIDETNPTTINVDNERFNALEKRMQDLEEYNELVIDRVDELSVLLDSLKKIGLEVNKESLYDQNKYLDTIKEVEELKENFLILINKVKELQNTNQNINNIPNEDIYPEEHLDETNIKLVEVQELINQSINQINSQIEKVTIELQNLITDKINALQDIYINKEQISSLNNIYSTKEELNIVIASLTDVYTTKEETNAIKELINKESAINYEEEIIKLQQYIDNVKEYSFKLNIKLSSIETDLEKLKAGSRNVNVVNKEHSSTEQSSKDLSSKEQSSKDLSSKEQSSNDELKEPNEKEELKTTTVEENIEKEVQNEKETNQNDDLTSRVYDVRIIERILHQARDQQCREEKAVLLSKWSKLEASVGHLLANTARILTNGKLVANGTNELLIIYPNATLCNHLMEEKIHLQAKQVLRITFGKEYDFIALSENVWQEKRNEYHGQYAMGIKYPKLTPIKDPNLRIIASKKEQNVPVKKTTLDEATKLFGSDIVEKEEE